MHKILVYNNDTKIVDAIHPLFGGEGLEMVIAKDWDDLEQMIQNESVQLLLTDINYSGRSGIEEIRKIRGLSSLPIIILSQNHSENYKIAALNAGADDYITIPCNPLEVMARIKSQLRRYTQLSNLCDNIQKIYRVDDLEINDMNRKVTVAGREVRLTPIEYKILKLLVRERGKVLSISQIYETIWHMQAIGADNTIAVHIRHIREKIESNPKEPRYIKVVWGTGYKVG